MKKIYCAGPLFNSKEKEEMAEIANMLEGDNYRVFLPHRDGFEFANLSETFKEIGVSEEKANNLINKAIFTLDVFQVLSSDGLVLNINGRVPDEGAMVEAGIAWNAGKKVVIYKNDARTLINGSDNPLLLGLSDFEVINEISNIPIVFNRYFSQHNKVANNIIDSSNLKNLYCVGERIALLAKNTQEKLHVCNQLIELLEGENVNAA